MQAYSSALPQPRSEQAEAHKGPTLDAFISSIFPECIDQQRKLLEAGAWDAGSPAGRQLACNLSQRVRPCDSSAAFVLGPAIRSWHLPSPVQLAPANLA